MAVATWRPAASLSEGWAFCTRRWEHMTASPVARVCCRVCLACEGTRDLHEEACSRLYLNIQEVWPAASLGPVTGRRGALLGGYLGLTVDYWQRCAGFRIGCPEVRLVVNGAPDELSTVAVCLWFSGQCDKGYDSLSAFGGPVLCRCTVLQSVWVRNGEGHGEPLFSLWCRAACLTAYCIWCDRGRRGHSGVTFS